jgi:hypothetical protein
VIGPWVGPPEFRLSEHRGLFRRKPERSPSPLTAATSQFNTWSTTDVHLTNGFLLVGSLDLSDLDSGSAELDRAEIKFGSATEE